jgi:hypothetical protein
MSGLCIEDLETLRKDLENIWSQETALPGTTSGIPSAGQCAASSVVIQKYMGGKLASTNIDGISHWFNRLCSDTEYDVDLTGDQFGYPKIQVAARDTLYPNAKERSLSDVNTETMKRVDILIKRLEVLRSKNSME